MKFFVELITKIVNGIHDLIQGMAKSAGYSLTDKELHFWIIGIIGIIGFFLVHFIFKKIAMLSITAISFIYTFTVVLVVVFAIEIEQGITGRGHMELADALVGLYGFMALFAMYVFFISAWQGVRYMRKRYIKKKAGEERRYYG